jgi:hypothetical protein
MARKKQKRTGSKKRKLKGRERRLSLAPEWIVSHRGKRDMVKKHCKTFNVDRECAIKELEELGVQHDPDYLTACRKTFSSQLKDENLHNAISRLEFDAYHGIEPESDDNFAYIAGYTSGGFPFGVAWEEWEEIEFLDQNNYFEQDT